MYNSINQINGIDIYDLELQGASTSINLQDYACMSELPDDNFTTMKIKMYIPFHPDENYLSGIEVVSSNRIIIRYNGGQYTKDVFVPGSLSYLGRIEDSYDSNKELSGFSEEAVIPNNYEVTRENFEFLQFSYYLIYKTVDDVEVHRSERSYTLLNSNC